MTVANSAKLQSLSTDQRFQLPFPLSEVVRYKNQLRACIKEHWIGEELADTYEEYGLSQLFLGNNLEAATNLDCACKVRKGCESIDPKSGRSLSLQFWVSMHCGLLYTESMMSVISQFLKST